jgi:hypothetical protein
MGRKVNFFRSLKTDVSWLKKKTVVSNAKLPLLISLTSALRAFVSVTLQKKNVHKTIDRPRNFSSICIEISGHHYYKKGPKP